MPDDEVIEKVYEKVPRGSLTARVLNKTKEYEELMEIVEKERKKYSDLEE